MNKCACLLDGAWESLCDLPLFDSDKGTHYILAGEGPGSGSNGICTFDDTNEDSFFFSTKMMLQTLKYNKVIHAS